MHQLKVKPSQQLLQHPRQLLLLRLLSLLRQLAAAAAVKVQRREASELAQLFGDLAVVPVITSILNI